MAARKLTHGMLNRALMARQLLLQKQQMAPLLAVRKLLGLQSQLPQNPYVALWSRIEGFDPMEASALLARRETVRLSTLRGTVHLHDAEDALALRAFTRPVHDSARQGRRFAFDRQLAGVRPEEFFKVARELLEEQPLTPGELGAALAERFPGYGATELMGTARYGMSVVQVTPRGEWGRSGAARLTTVEHWLGRPEREPDPAWVEALLLRYLAAFGPASVQDAQTWCGVTRLGEVFERLRPRLEVFADAETGRELFDLPDAPRPDAETPVPVRFLPDYDNVLLSHADRTRVMGEDGRAALWRDNGFQPALLIDGRVAGSWSYRKPARKDAPAVLEARLLAEQPAAARAEVEAEAEALLTFLAPKAAERTVTLHLTGQKA